MAAWLATMTWMLVSSLAFIGLGGLAQRVARVRTGDVWRSFWWGLVAAMPLAAAWHLVAPLNDVAAAVFALLGACGLWLDRARWPRTVRSYLKHRRGAVAVWLAAWALLPWLSLQPLSCLDAGYYYVVGVEWHRAFAAIPGLQVTNPLSVFNTGAFLTMPLVGSGPFAGEGHLVFNAMLAWWGLPVLGDAVQTLTRRWSLPAVALAFAIVPALDALPTDRMSCPSADIGVLWLGLAGASMALRTRLRGGGVLLWLALLPMFKLSLASTAIALLLLVRWRGLLRVAVIAAVAWVPFIAGNVVSSGYLLYPAARLRVDVEWAMATGLVEQVSAIITGYSRHDGIVGNDDAWLPVWRLMLMNRAVLLPTLLLVGSLLVTAARAVRHRWPLATWRPVAATLVGVAVWFRLAPDPRFAGVLLWLTAALALATGLGIGRRTLAPSFAARLGLLLALGLALFGDLPFTSWPTLPHERPPLPDNANDARVTLEDGTQVLDCTPGRMDGKGPACWTIPCVSLFPPGVRLRVPGDVSKGFVAPESARLPQSLVY